MAGSRAATARAAQASAQRAARHPAASRSAGSPQPARHPRSDPGAWRHDSGAFTQQVQPAHQPRRRRAAVQRQQRRTQSGLTVQRCARLAPGARWARRESGRKRCGPGRHPRPRQPPPYWPDHRPYALLLMFGQYADRGRRELSRTRRGGEWNAAAAALFASCASRAPLFGRIAASHVQRMLIAAERA